MKKYYILLFVLLIICCTGFGCENTNIENNFSSGDCLGPLDGWEEKQTGRFIKGDQIFEEDDNWGLRCRYYEPKSQKFELDYATGDFQNHYESEIRTFIDNEEMNSYNQKQITERFDDYCRKGSEVVMPYVLRDGAFNERYQCSWPAEKNENSLDQINTNTLISITTYKNSIILSGVIKETGKVTFTPADDSNSAMQTLYNSSEFQIIPDKHEEDLINHALNIIDNK